LRIRDDERQMVKFSKVFMLTTVIVSLLAGLCGFFVYDVPLAVVYLLRGEILHFHSAVEDVGEIPVGASRTVSFRVTNLSSKEILIAGARIDCGCARPVNLPLVISPQESETLKFELTGSEKARTNDDGVFRVKGFFYTEPETGKKTILIKGRIVAPERAP